MRGTEATPKRLSDLNICASVDVLIDRFAAKSGNMALMIGFLRNDLVFLDAATGADGHVQVNNRIRLTQEVSGWLSEVLPEGNQ